MAFPPTGTSVNKCGMVSVVSRAQCDHESFEQRVLWTRVSMCVKGHEASRNGSPLQLARAGPMRLSRSFSPGSPSAHCQCVHSPAPALASIL
jgi:hypothetical protein